jgi:NitT/TauT family transport system permease protein
MKTVLTDKFVLPVLTFLAVVLLWELVSRNYSTYILPSPKQVAASMVSLLLSGELIKHTVASLFRVTAGFYLAVIIGVPVGMLLGVWRRGKMLFNPLIQFLRPISPLAWIPLAMLWFGIGDQPAIFLIFLSSFFPIAVSTAIAVEGIRPTYFQVAANFGFTPAEQITKLIFPAILPQVINALRISLCIAWLVVVAAEMIAVTSGLGYLIIDARNGLRMDYVIVAMIMIGGIGLFLDFLMNKMMSIKSVNWGFKTR